MEFDFGEYTIRVRDNEHWREMLHGMAREMFEEAGADTDTEEFDDFKYDVLEGTVLDVISDAIREAADDDRLKLDNFKDFFDRIERRSKDMCFNTKYERDFYSVEIQNGEKVVHLLGFLWLQDDGGYWVHEAMDAFVPVSSCSEDELDAAQCAVTHYWGELADEIVKDFVATYYDGEPGEYLPLDKIDGDTPCGNYWC